MENLSETTKVVVGLLTTFIITMPVWWLYKKYFIDKQLEKIAQIFFKMHKGILLNDYSTNRVEASKFRSLDLDFYEKVSNKLSSLKFQLIGDFENLINKNLKLPIDYFFRLMISDDGKVKSVCYQLKDKNVSYKIIEFTTETANGTVLITSNSKLTSKLEHPKEILYEFLYTDITDELLKLHLARIKKIETIGNLEVLKVVDLSELTEQNKRIQNKIRNFRMKIDKAIIIKELNKFALTNLYSRTNSIEKIADRILELHKTEILKGSLSDKEIES